MFEKRSFEVRADSEKSIITGRPIVFNSRTDLGDCDEIIEAGALDKANLSDVRFLINHDLNKIPLARAKAGDSNSTMKISVDKDGMGISVELDTENNSEARALYSAVKRGDISGMSFMFSIDDEEWENLDSEHPTRHIKSISQVVEVSAVTFPAYGTTEIYARDKKALDNAKKTLDSAKRSLDSEKEKKELELLKIKYQILLK